MSFKTVLVHAGLDAQSQTRVRAALSVAAEFDAAVIGAGAEGWAPYVDPTFGYVDGATVQAFRDALDENLRKAGAEFEALCAAETRRHAWRSAVDFPAQFVVELARGADLIVAGRPGERDGNLNFAGPGDVVMQAGTPVLVVPPGCAAVKASTVMIAWKDTREARRALADAMPFLQRADKVLLMQVCEAGAPHEVRQHDLLDRLKRHGIDAMPQFRTMPDHSAGDALIEAAMSHQADLIVAGAYGHTRLREWALGGVTRTLIEASPVPVLFGR